MESRALLRGTRGDQNTPGLGPGLAMVQDTLALHDGELLLHTGKRGGLEVRLRLPDRSH